MFLPGGTPKDVVAKLHAETVKALASPDVKEFLTKDGAEAVGSTPEELAAFFRREVAKYAKVIAAANVRAD
jgi:tripartite-type tricarboxylate transporter receptor subunit TctC